MEKPLPMGTGKVSGISWEGRGGPRVGLLGQGRGVLGRRLCSGVSQVTGAMSARDWLPGFLGTGDCQRVLPRFPAGSHPFCPFFSVPGGADDAPVHHPGGRYHHGVLGHRRAPGAWRQAQSGDSRHRMLHVLPQLGLAWGSGSSRTCQQSTA